jgi:4-hydroxy-tetrahydrodipicolinate reductase
MARLAAKNHINLVIGTTGLAATDLEEMGDLCQSYEIGAVVAPNFSLGAAIMLHLAKVAAKFFDFAEIIELHHEGKADAPSGTAISTAEEMVAARGRDFPHSTLLRESLKGSRGAELGGVALHSIRLPGLMAHQEVIFGAQGETLRIRHDAIDRGCYMPGVILAIKEVVKRRGLISGLDKLVGL